MRVPRIAFGYTRYQNDWPEQTPAAIEYLRDALSDLNLQLLCPVSDLSSRDEAIRELKENGLSITSLEQKCTRQLTNVALQPAELERELIVWRALLGRGAERLEDLPVDVVSTALVGANPGPR